VPAKRLAQLERQYRVVAKQIVNSANAADIAQLEKHRDAIVAEAREIVRKLNLPEPNWTQKKV
jgi:hypothetical protein